MFALRGIAVSLTFFVLLYFLLSVFVALAWRSLKHVHTTPRNLADLLFALRILPLVASVAITLAFVVPSFQLLEPRSIDEGTGALPLALGICALLLLVCGSLRVIAAQVSTSRMVAHWLDDKRLKWLDDPRPLRVGDQPEAFQSGPEAPPLTLVGVRRPKVLVSQSAIELLSDDELHIALKHELAHARSRDNLKKLVFRFCPFPGMSRLESIWSQTAELAADDAAVSNLAGALDLAAALVKLSRLVPSDAAAAICTVGFVTGPISARVARLLAWNEAKAGQSQPIPMRPWCAIPAACLALLCLGATYGPALALTHEVTEWLVR
jgi:Zn-dependent protease with chaperone function